MVNCCRTTERILILAIYCHLGPSEWKRKVTGKHFRRAHHQARNKRLLKGFDDGDDNEDDMKLDHQQHLFLLRCHLLLLIRIVCVCVWGEYPGDKTAKTSMSLEMG